MERFLKSRYKIGDKISESPFSVTYKGSFLGSNKAVVIKIYKRGTLNSSLINRMKHKVKDLSLINHHGIAKLIDGDYGWQGFYYVRDYVEGKSLEELLSEEQELGTDKIIIIAEEICRALELVHAKDIIHGALKPSNIFIDPKGVVKVADFVIEGAIKEAMPQKVFSIMEDGKYVSPEELAGKPAMASSDIYSLGLILFESVFAKAPAAANIYRSGLKGGISKLGKNRLFDKELLAPLPKYLQDIIIKALQADPLLRFATIGELRQSLEKKSLIMKKPQDEEYITIFDTTVTQFGGEHIEKETEPERQEKKVKKKEKRRNWVLLFILLAAFFSGLIYGLMIVK